MLLYVEDCLCVSGSIGEALEEVNKYFPMKALSIGPPNIYLRAKVDKVQLPNGVEAYAIIISHYVQESVKNAEKYLHDRGIALLKKALTLLLKYYILEVDGSTELDEIEADLYQ